MSRFQHKIPAFSLGGSNPINITVNLSDWNPDPSSGSCAGTQIFLNAQRQVIGGVVTLYHYANNPTDGVVDCSPTYKESIAHELGHVLGLDDAPNSCAGYIMTGPTAQLQPDGTLKTVPGTRSVKAGECFGANKQWLMSPPRGAETAPPEPAPATQPPGNCWTCDTPLVISLTSEAYHLTSVGEGVRFDLDADGEREPVAWTRADSGLFFLSRDLNGNGNIDDGSELFGTATRLKSGKLATNGFEALRELDDNRDGWIDEKDSIWRDLLLWEDRNHNGVADSGELTPVSMTSLIAISLNYHRSGKRDVYGNEFRFKSMVKLRHATDGQQFAPMYDIFFVRGFN